MRIPKVPLIILLFLCNSSFAQQPEYVPMAAGTTWSFKGTVKWTELVNKIKQRKITWKMEVEKRLKNGSFEIAVMKGHPSDLCWYEPDKKPSRYLIVWRDNKYYEIRIDNDFDKLISDEAYLSSKTNYSSLFLAIPLKRGLEFGSDPDTPREGTFYEWFVEDEQRGLFSHVTGIPHGKYYQKFTLMYRTMPDHQMVEFVPFVGITKYSYQHHGTVSEVDVRLTEFRK